MFSQSAKDITKIMERQRKRYEEIFNNQKSTNMKSKTMQSMFLECDPEDIGQQMCIYDFKLFQAIHPIEFLNQIWKREGEEDASPTLDFFISRFDKESYWVATEVCMIRDLKKRTKALQKFILLAKECQKLGNFFSMFALVAGLNLSPVQRLKKTWENLSSKAKTAYEEMEKMCDPSKNMKNYRDCLEQTKPPIVPFLRKF